MKFVKNVKLLMAVGLLLGGSVVFSSDWEKQGQAISMVIRDYHEQLDLEESSKVIVSIEAGDLEGLKSALSDSNININDESKVSSETILMRALSKGHKDIIQLLLDKGADPHVKMYGDNTALREAVKKAHADKRFYTEIIKLFINVVSDNSKDSMSFALIDAVRAGYKDIVQLLFDKGADINIKCTSMGGSCFECTTPLMTALASNDEDMVKLVLSKNANPNAAETMTNNTPLMVAAWTNNERIVKLLLAHGANPNAKNLDGETALSFSKSATITKLITKAMQ